jgi:hypothetical protein
MEVEIIMQNSNPLNRNNAQRTYQLIFDEPQKLHYFLEADANSSPPPPSSPRARRVGGGAGVG